LADTIDPISYKSSYRLAGDQIRRAIELGTYVPGDRLPPSRELAYQLGISVATLREAVRGLIEQGLVEMHRGPKGGLVVLPYRRDRRHRISRAALAELEQLLELRKALEGESARLAAERRTRSDLARLQRAYDSMLAELDKPEDGLRAARFIRADSHFHAAIARAARSTFLASAIEDTRARMFAVIGGTLLPLTRDANAGHNRMLSEIRRGRPGAAANAARRHIDTTLEDAHRALTRLPKPPRDATQYRQGRWLDYG
jgi:GntR family transcriptional regulator, transcriptional repressor for pyruvate dehydrogenase complex